MLKKDLLKFMANMPNEMNIGFMIISPDGTREEFGELSNREYNGHKIPKKENWLVLTGSIDPITHTFPAKLRN